MFKDKFKKVKEKAVEKKEQAKDFAKEHSTLILVYGGMGLLVISGMVSNSLNRRMKRKELRRFYDKALEQGAKFTCINMPKNQVVHKHGEDFTVE